MNEELVLFINEKFANFLKKLNEYELKCQWPEIVIVASNSYQVLRPHLNQKFHVYNLEELKSFWVSIFYYRRWWNVSDGVIEENQQKIIHK